MRRGHLTGIMVVLLIAMGRPSVAVACTCVTGPETCPAAATGDVVFEATVTSIDIDKRSDPDGSYSFGPRTIHLRDVRAWRGGAVEVIMTGNGGGDCGYDFRVGTRYAIVGYRNSRDGRIWTGICSKTRPLAEAGSLREYVVSLSAPSQGGRVWGTVLTEGPRVETNRQDSNEFRRQPVAAARVLVEGPVHRSETVDAGGQFTFAALPAGEYTVRVELPPNRRDLRPSRSYTVTLDRAYACTELNVWLWREP